jgi:hypothetical protein
MQGRGGLTLSGLCVRCRQLEPEGSAPEDHRDRPDAVPEGHVSPLQERLPGRYAAFPFLPSRLAPPGVRGGEVRVPRTRMQQQQFTNLLIQRMLTA